MRTIQSKKPIQRSTLLNFFAKKGSDGIVLPLPVSEKKPPPKKQTKKTISFHLGRPKAADQLRREKIEKLSTELRRNHVAGDLSVAPTNRKKWNGSVRNIVYERWLFSFYNSCVIFALLPNADDAESYPFDQSILG